MELEISFLQKVREDRIKIINEIYSLKTEKRQMISRIRNQDPKSEDLKLYICGIDSRLAARANIVRTLHLIDGFVNGKSFLEIEPNARRQPCLFTFKKFLSSYTKAYTTTTGSKKELDNWIKETQSFFRSRGKPSLFFEDVGVHPLLTNSEAIEELLSYFSK